MTTNLTNGTQVSIDPSTLPINWQTGTTYQFNLNADYVTEVGNNRLSSPAQTASITTFSTLPDVVSVSPAYATTGVYTSTVLLTYNRNVRNSTSSNYYLYSGTNLIASLNSTSPRIRTTQSVTTTVISRQSIVPLSTSTDIHFASQPGAASQHLPFRPVNTSSFIRNILPYSQTFGPNSGGVSDLKFNTTTLTNYCTYFKYQDKYYLQVWNGSPNSGTPVTSSSVYDNWSTYSTGTLTLNFGQTTITPVQTVTMFGRKLAEFTPSSTFENGDKTGYNPNYFPQLVEVQLYYNGSNISDQFSLYPTTDPALGIVTYCSYGYQTINDVKEFYLTGWFEQYHLPSLPRQADVGPTNLYKNWSTYNNGTLEIAFTVPEVIVSTATIITQPTKKDIFLNWTGHILPNTTYHVRADQGAALDMFNFKAPAIPNDQVLKWTSGDGPGIIQITPPYNTSANVTEVQIKFTKTMVLNTGSFYLNNDTSIVRFIPVISPSVSLLNTNTVSILIDNIPTPEDSYYLTWDEGVLLDTNSIALFGAVDDSYVKFYDVMITGMKEGRYDHANPTYVFTGTLTPSIIENGTGTYELRVSSPYGEFSHLTTGTNYPTYWSITGSPSSINSIISGIKFVPQTNYGIDTTYTWQLLRNGVTIYNKTFPLIGSAYQLPITPPGNPDSVAPNNVATLTLTCGSLGTIYEPVTLTANIVSYLDMSGTVQFKVGNNVIANAEMSTAGVATTTTIFSTTGTRVISATWLEKQLSNNFKYGGLNSNTASIFIDAAAFLNLSISSTETPQIISNNNVFVATANTSTAITGPVTFGVYNTSTRAFTTVLGTSTFANNTATITVNSGTLAVGTYTVAAVWTGSNAIPKYYASTATMTQRYVNRGVVRLDVNTTVTDFYWHNIDGVSLNTQATSQLTVNGIYTGHQPTGIAKLFDGATQLDSMDLSQRSTFAWNPADYNQINAGVKTLTVQYLGDQWNLPATTSTVFDTVTLTTGTYRFNALTRRSSSMTLTTTATTSTIYRPYGITQFKSQTTSTYWNNKLINILDGATQIATAPVTGTTATFTIDSQSLSTGSHIIKTQYPQDFAYNEMFSNTLSLRILKTTLPITLTRNSATVLRPSTVSINIASTTSYLTPETVQIYDNGQPWFTATFSGTSTTITTSSSFFSTGTHIIKAGIAEDFNYNAVESSTSSIFIDKSTIPLKLDSLITATLTSTNIIVPIGLVNEFDHTMLEFRPVNTATFLSNFTAQPLNGDYLIPGPGGTEFNLYFNGNAVDDIVIGQNPTYYQYYIKNNRYFIQVWRIDNISGQPNEYAGPVDDDNPIFNKWTTYSTGTVVADISTVKDTIIRPNNVIFRIRSTSTFNVPKTVKILDNGVLFTSTTYTGTLTSITTSSSYIPVGSHNFQVSFDGDNDYYPTLDTIQPLNIDKFQPGNIVLSSSVSSIIRPNTFVVTATTVDSFYNNKNIILISNNQNISSMTFSGFTATTTVSSMNISTGTNNLIARFVETNDSYPVNSNISTVTASKAVGPVISLIGPLSTSATIVSNNLTENRFNRNLTTGTTLTFTATTTGSYWANKSINFYSQQTINNSVVKTLVSSTTLINGSVSVSIQTTSSLFLASVNNFVNAEIPEDDIYSTSTHVNLLYSTGTGVSGWRVEMAGIQTIGSGHAGYNSDYGLVLSASTSTATTSSNVTYTITVNDQYPGTPYSMLTALQGQSIRLTTGGYIYTDYISTFSGTSLSITIPGSILRTYGSTNIGAEAFIFTTNTKTYYTWMLSNALTTVINL
jgi:hypothetical protein